MAKAPAGIGAGFEPMEAAEDEDVEAAPVDLDHESKVMAMKDFGAALKKGDWEAAATAFETAYEACASAKEAEASQEEGEEGEEPPVE